MTIAAARIRVSDERFRAMGSFAMGTLAMGTVAAVIKPGAGDIVIRPIEPADFGAVLAINEANVPEVSSLDVDRLRFLVDDAAFSLVVDVDGVIAGFCLVLGPGSTYDSVNYRWFMERFDDAMYLDRVAFADDFQGRGLGTALYADVHERVSAIDGIARWTLEVNLDPPNVDSLAFHAARGFTAIGQQHTPYGITVSLMQREVTTTQPESPTTKV